MKIGEYDVRIVGKDETTSLPLKKGEAYYMVRLDKSSWMDVEEHIDAEVLSRLVRVEVLLKKLTNGVYVKYPKYAQQTNHSNELKGKDAVNFVKEMKKTEKRKPNKVEKYLMEGLK